MTDDNKKVMDEVSPEVVKAIREQVLKELEDRDAVKREKQALKRTSEKDAREKYLEEMRTSSNPWVEIIGINVDKDNQIKIELDWNVPFVEYLKKSGYTGPDEDTIVQRYVAVLSKQIADDMEIDDEGQ